MAVRTKIVAMTKVRRKQLLAAVADLREYDHLFLSPAGVDKFAKAFGLPLKAYRHKADGGPKNPKGLYLDNGATEAYGRDATDLAREICNSFGVEYEPKLGRGFQLQTCCNALETFFRGDAKETHG